MIHKPRRLTALILAALTSLFLLSAPTTGQIPVTDTVHIIETVIAAIDRYAQLAESIEHEIQNLEQVDDWNVREVLDVLTGFAYLLAYAESLVYSDLGLLEERWFETFHIDVIDPLIHLEGADGLAQLRRHRTLDTLWGVMRGIQLQANNITAGQRLLEDIKVQGEDALGNLDTAQVTIMISAYQAEELAQIRQLVAAQTNVLLVTQAAEQSARAQATEELIHWLGLRDPLPPVGGFASQPI
jgi:P-type conjugative transfer protein TrbJ